MKRLKLGFKKPEKKVELEKGSVLVAEHKGDVNYLRYVRFKQLAPQFWERMDSPLFVTYLEKIQDAWNSGKWMQGYNFLLDYKMAIDQSKQPYDAWGLCFALISYEDGEEMEFVPTDVQLEEKLARMVKNGLTPDVIQEGVVNFMKASPETFQDHLILLELQSTMTATV
jgi:hypothetical protein